MKSIIRSKKGLAAILLFTIAFASCKKDVLTNSEAITSNPDVYLNKENMLVFKNVQVLKEKLEENLKSNGKIAKELSSDFPNFISMNKIFNEFDKQESSIVEKLSEELKGKNFNAANYLFLSDIGKKYKNMILVKQYPDNNEYYYDMNIREKSFSDFVNPQGLLMVDKAIYQFSENHVKIITDGNLSKIKLLSSYNVTDESQNILVFNSSHFILGFSENNSKAKVSAGCTDTKELTSTGQANNKRLTMRTIFNQNPEGTNNKSTFTVGLVTLKRKVVFAWFAATADYIIIRGEFSGPRTPVDYNNWPNYHVPNPFNQYYSSEIIHFTDYSDQVAPCYSMTSGRYTMSAYFDGVETAATIAW